MRTTPWLVEKAITFLTEYFKTHQNPNILEFGMGGSTIWVSKRTNKLISVDHDITWLNKVKEIIKTKNTILHLIPRPYDKFCNNFKDETFDLILIDGRDRVKCIESSIRILKSGGILMLDNSERIRYKSGINLMNGWKKESYIEESDPSYLDDDNKLKKWETSWWTKP